uniref:Phosphatidylglycerophosphatase and protein-tyrosine phosphatase 1 n=1 Tax=Ascaris suum TaxID=6253 RepID=F1L1Y2_ASCSU
MSIVFSKWIGGFLWSNVSSRNFKYPASHTVCNGVLKCSSIWHRRFQLVAFRPSLMFSLIMFYPSLGYNIIRNYLQAAKWPWYSRIDDVVIQGALPFRSMVDELKNKENVGGVVCCTEEFETKAAWSSMTKEDWAQHEIAFHEIPMKDFVGSSSRPEIQRAVQFINNIAKQGKSVYVHCKAGRTRSTTLVVCYLMQRNNWMPNVAFEYLKMKRPHALLRSAHWRSVNEYRRFLDHEATS